MAKLKKRYSHKQQSLIESLKRGKENASWRKDRIPIFVKKLYDSGCLEISEEKGCKITFKLANMARPSPKYEYQLREIDGDKAHYKRKSRIGTWGGITAEEFQENASEINIVAWPEQMEGGGEVDAPLHSGGGADCKVKGSHKIYNLEGEEMIVKRDATLDPQLHNIDGVQMTAKQFMEMKNATDYPQTMGGGGQIAAEQKFEAVMHEWGQGNLHHGGTGEIVQHPQQQDIALAIAFSEARKIDPGYGQMAGGGAVQSGENDVVKSLLWQYLKDTAYKIDRVNENLFLVELQKDATPNEITAKINNIRDVEIIKGVIIPAPFIADGVDADESKKRSRQTLRVISNIEKMANGGSVSSNKPTWVAHIITTDNQLIAERFDKPISHRELFKLYEQRGYQIKNSTIFQVNNMDVIDSVLTAINEYSKEKYDEEIDREMTMIAYDIVDKRAIVQTISSQTLSGHSFDIKPADLFNSVKKMAGGGSVQSNNQINDLYDLRISLGKYGSYPKSDAMAATMRDTFLKNNGRVDRAKWDSTITKLSKYNPEWENEWQEYKQFSEIETSNGQYINPYQMAGGGTIKATDIPVGTWLQHKTTKTKAKVWDVDPILGWMKLEDIYGNKNNMWRPAKNWKVTTQPPQMAGGGNIAGDYEYIGFYKGEKLISVQRLTTEQLATEPALLNKLMDFAINEGAKMTKISKEEYEGFSALDMADGGAVQSDNKSNYVISYIVDGQKRSVTANSKEEAEGIKASMQSGQWREDYQNIEIKKMAGGGTVKSGNWQVYYMDNDGLKQVVAKNLSYDRAVKLSQQMYSEGTYAKWELQNTMAGGGEIGSYGRTFMYEVEKVGEDQDIADKMFSAKNLQDLKQQVISKYGTTEGFIVRRRDKSTGAYYRVNFGDSGNIIVGRPMGAMPEIVAKIMPNHQQLILDQWTEESTQLFADLKQKAEAVPKIGAQDGKGNESTVYLHYFVGASDWYITEWNGDDEFFGYAILNGDLQNSEFGYMSMREFNSTNIVELDFHWKPVTLNEAFTKGGYSELVDNDYKPAEVTEGEQGSEPTELDLAKGKDQMTITNEIVRIVEENGLDREKYSMAELAYLRHYEGYGSLAKQSEAGTIKGAFLDQFFTPDFVIEKMIGLAHQHGLFTDIGKLDILEPSCGTGRFLEYFDKQHSVDAYEIDEIPYIITQLTFPQSEYPNFNIVHAPFEAMFYQGKRHTGILGAAKQYDLVIGNPPYKDFTSSYGDAEQKETGAHSMDQYFLMRGIDLLKSGGLLVFVIPNTFLSNDNKYNDFKESLNVKAEMVDAYRLPNGIFGNTEVGTDIVVFRKR